MGKIGKRGQGLPLSTIVIFIIVVVVLVVVVAFFLTGSTGITDSIRKVFSGATAGVDMSLASANCQQYCTQARSLATDELKEVSAYCIRWENIDRNQDGESEYTMVGSDKRYTRWYCPSQDTYDIEPIYDAQIEYLNVPCDLRDQEDIPIKCASSA